MFMFARPFPACVHTQFASTKRKHKSLKTYDGCANSVVISSDPDVCLFHCQRPLLPQDMINGGTTWRHLENIHSYESCALYIVQFLIDTD
jgi:hypothetical protein